MKLDELIITENTKINDILEFLNLDLSSFYYEFMSTNINRVECWRKFENNKIYITKKKESGEDE